MSDHYRLVRPLTSPIPPAWPDGAMLAPFVFQDIPAIHRLLRRAYAHGGGSVTDLDQWWSAIAADSEFAPELCVVAKNSEGAIAGFALVWTSAFIKDLVVAPEWQGRGLGTAMLHEISGRLLARGHRSVALKVASDNKGAERLYRSLGFTED